MLHRMRRDRSRGQALVEFALVIPIFVLLLVGLFDIGRAVWNYNTVANSAREAARVAVVNQDQVAIREAAKRAGVSLGLEDADITLIPCPTQECPYSVTVTYDYEPVTPLISSLFDLTLTSTAVMPLEYENGP
jgi:hypothetical protein